MTLAPADNRLLWALLAPRLRARHPATAIRIATKLCVRFVADEAPAALADRRPEDEPGLVIARRVFAPARDRQVLPTAVPAACVGDHHVVAAVRQKLHFRGRRLRRIEDPHRYLQEPYAVGGP